MSNSSVKFSYYDPKHKRYDKNPLPQWNPYAEGVYGNTIKEMKDVNSCTVVTLAIVTGRSYQDCNKYLYKYGRRLRTGMFEKEIISALEGMKTFKVVRGQYSNNNRITLNQFVKRHPKGKYFVCHRGHAFAVVDGVVFDHSNQKRRQVTLAYRVYSQEDLRRLKNGK